MNRSNNIRSGRSRYDDSESEEGSFIRSDSRDIRSRSVKNRKKRRDFDDWISDCDEDNNLSRKRDRLRSKSRLRDRNLDSDESSDHRDFRERTQSKSRRARDHNHDITTVKRSESRKSFDSDSDSHSDNRRNFSSKSNLSRRDTSHMSYNLDKDSDSDNDTQLSNIEFSTRRYYTDSSRSKEPVSRAVYNSDVSTENSRRIVQRTGSNPNVLHRPYSSRPNVDRTINHNSAFHGSFNSLEPISARPQLTKSSSSIVMARQNILDQSIPGASFHNNNQRQTVSRA